ncbi:MAG: tRNA (adenosine(37)-N6)-threonylcarbamoyltransferase complex dimerization subunit type 1 TsaB [Liquorilactobacillus hordei]|uniref:tRNA (adenosine(37)-N6)-threonylcarbamoyltransferase complex dimerization subunit type 1 TsaB n=1 Tax=Liquorilactobacillus hordei TaxID=468911 RepID=UPI0039E755B8
MNILAIDTSNQPLSIAILKDEELVATTTTNQSKNHSVTLMPQIANLLSSVGMKAMDIDRFVVAKGPGSYTGLRIGVTTAKTFAFTLGKELVGISSLAVLADSINVEETMIVPIFDARRDNVFTGVYSKDSNGLTNIIPDQHISLENLLEKTKKYQRIIFVGSDSHKFEKQILEKMDEQQEITFSSMELDYPQAYRLGLLGLKGKPADIHSFVPDYLRLTQAESQWLENHQGRVDEALVEKI